MKICKPLSLLILVLLWPWFTGPAHAGVARAIQETYREKYENKALFLRFPIFEEKLIVSIEGARIRRQPSGSLPTPRFKVGEQVRILKLDFGGDQIKIKVGSIEGTGQSEIVYSFSRPLEDSFPNRKVFDNALEATFTQGLRYSDLEEAKRSYAREEFGILVRELADSTSMPRDGVLEAIVADLPTHRDALKDLENVKQRLSELNGTLEAARLQNQRLEEALQQEKARANQAAAEKTSLESRAEDSGARASRLQSDLQKAQRELLDYKSRLGELQQSLNLRVDANRSLESQVGSMKQALQKLQKDKESLAARGAELARELASLEGTNRRLSGELTDLQGSNRKLEATIKTLSSGKDSIAREYMELKRINENLEQFKESLAGLHTRTLGQTQEGGEASQKIALYIHDVHAGDFEMRMPARVDPGESAPAMVRFSRHSVDPVQLSPPERKIFRSLGDSMRLRVTLTPATPSGKEAAAAVTSVSPEGTAPLQTIEERAQGEWRWNIRTHGAEDLRLTLRADLLNRNDDAVTILTREYAVSPESLVRRARRLLQPIPLVVGALLGSLLVGIVGIFRRGKGPARTSRRSVPRRAEPSPLGKKQL